MQRQKTFGNNNYSHTFNLINQELVLDGVETGIGETQHFDRPCVSRTRCLRKKNIIDNHGTILFN